MAKFSFGNFNVQRVFDVDTSDFEYKSLEDLYNENGAEYEYQLKGAYIGTKSDFAPETPLVAIANNYVNLPQHQLSAVKAILADKEAIRAINEGRAGFIIEKYFKKSYNRWCYSAQFIDVNPDDYVEE